MNDKKGFTLLELLIAAALMGVLAMFATQAFRASASDVRLEDAKARAALLFSAAQRYYIEYPDALPFNKTSNDDEGISFLKPGACQAVGVSKSAEVQNLVNCGLLEYRQVAQEASSQTGTARTFTGYVDMWFEFKNGDKNNIQVCFRGKEGGRVLDRCAYCTSDGEHFEKKTGTCSGE